MKESKKDVLRGKVHISGEKYYFVKS